MGGLSSTASSSGAPIINLTDSSSTGNSYNYLLWTVIIIIIIVVIVAIIAGIGLFMKKRNTDAIEESSSPVESVPTNSPTAA